MFVALSCQFHTALNGLLKRHVRFGLHTSTIKRDAIPFVSQKKEHLIVQRGTIDTQVMVRGRNGLSYELINTVHISIRFQLFRYTDLW